MIIHIDEKSGYCFGVRRAIEKAEKELEKNGKLYCLGDIVHNKTELERLKSKGLIVINDDQYSQLHDCTVLIRAHGEPPITYDIARKNNIQLIDASCQVVVKIQERIRNLFQNDTTCQIVIFGKKEHPEINGLNGQTNNRAIIVTTHDDLNCLDFTNPIHLYSQTTMPLAEFYRLVDEIKKRMRQVNTDPDHMLFVNDTVCRQVANRIPHLQQFAKQNDVIIFSSSKESSNGKLMFDAIKKVNPNSYFVSNIDELKKEWFVDIEKVGICGATSTPRWAMEQVAEQIRHLISS